MRNILLPSEIFIKCSNLLKLVILQLLYTYSLVCWIIIPRTPPQWQCHNIFGILFLLKRFDLGPIWTDKNDLRNVFVFAKLFDRKARKIRLRAVLVSSESLISRLYPRKQIFQQNYFSLLIRCPDGFDSWNKKLSKNLVTLPLYGVPSQSII